MANSATSGARQPIDGAGKADAGCHQRQDCAHCGGEPSMLRAADGERRDNRDDGNGADLAEMDEALVGALMLGIVHRRMSPGLWL